MIPPGRSLTMRCKVAFIRGPRGRKLAAPAQEPKAPAVILRPVIDPSSIPRLTRYLVLGHRLEQLVRDGVVKNHTALARLFGISKERVTQLVNLTLLAPDIQSEILQLDNPDIRGQRLFERNLRQVTALADWNEQRAAFNLTHR